MTEGLSLSTLLLDRYWDVYVVLKHSSELAILVLELFISTAIKIYSADSTNTNSAGVTGVTGTTRRRSSGGNTSAASESTPLLGASASSSSQGGISSLTSQQQRGALKYTNTTTVTSHPATVSSSLLPRQSMTARSKEATNGTYTINI